MQLLLEAIYMHKNSKSFFILSSLILSFVLISCDTGGSDNDETKVLSPDFSIPAGYAETGTAVVITTETEDAVIYYTTDDTDPFESDSVIEGPKGESVSVTITQNVNLRAYAGKSGMSDSDAVSVFYEAALVVDSFEDGTLEGWESTGEDTTDILVDDTQGANGTGKSLMLDNSLVEGTYDDGSVKKEFTTGFQPTYISFYAMYEENESTSGAEYGPAIIFHDNPDTSSANSILYTEFSVENGSNRIDFNDESTPVDSVERNTWYHIEMKNFDWSAGLVDIYFNGTYQFADDIDLPAATGSNTLIYLITIGSDAGGPGDEQSAWVDELVVQ